MKLKEILRIAQDKKLGSWHCEILLDDERAEVMSVALSSRGSGDDEEFTAQVMHTTGPIDDDVQQTVCEVLMIFAWLPRRQRRYFLGKWGLHNDSSGNPTPQPAGFDAGAIRDVDSPVLRGTPDPASDGRVER